MLLAKLLRKKVILYGVDAGSPKNDVAISYLYRQILRIADSIITRDELLTQSLPGSLYFPDPVFAWKPTLLEKEPSFIGVNVSPFSPWFTYRKSVPFRELYPLDIERYSIFKKVLAKALDSIIEQYSLPVKFVYMTRHNISWIMNDERMCNEVQSLMEHRSQTIIESVSSGFELWQLVKGMRFAIGMRLHFLILAAMGGVPFVALSHRRKQRILMEQLRWPYQLGLLELNSDRLLSYVEKLFQDNQMLHRFLLERSDELRQEAERGLKMLEVLVKNEKA